MGLTLGVVGLLCAGCFFPATAPIGGGEAQPHLERGAMLAQSCTACHVPVAGDRIARGAGAGGTVGVVPEDAE